MRVDHTESENKDEDLTHSWLAVQIVQTQTWIAPQVCPAVRISAFIVMMIEVYYSALLCYCVITIIIEY